MKQEERISATQKRLLEAWDNMPFGSKTQFCDEFGYKKQNILDMLKNGRKDEAITLQLIKDIKTFSRSFTQNLIENNKKLQAI